MSLMSRGQEQRVNTLVQVVVVIGAGGIGQAIARLQGSGKTVLLADLNQETLGLGGQGARGERPQRHHAPG